MTSDRAEKTVTASAPRPSDTHLEIPLTRLSQARPVKAGIALFSIVRNEQYFLPHFLSHYRALGVRHFVFLDDHSTDGTRALLLSQPDCEIFESELRFGEPFHGVPFHKAVKHVVPGQLLSDRWVLTVDADEFLLLPPAFQTIEEFCIDLDRQGLDHCRGLMIDFFPQHLSDIDRLGRHDDPFTAAPFFDALTQVDWPEGASMPANLSYHETVRVRLFHTLLQSDPDLLPQFRTYRYANLNKVPLLRWRPGVHAVGSHRINVPVSARNQLVLAHFKFYPGWRQVVKENLERAVHWNGAIEYRMLAAAGQRLSDTCVLGPVSRRYLGRQQLADMGLIFSARSTTN